MNTRSGLIAVVDDEELVRRAVHRLLRSAGFSVETYAAGREFLESLQSHQPDCVLLDLHMPEMNGFEVLEQLQRTNPQLHAIIITGYDSPDSRERTSKAGAVAFLLKPVEGQLLLETIISAIPERSA